MAVKKEYLEDIDSKEFYEFYKKNRKKTSPKMNQEMLFKKAIHGFLIEAMKCLNETEHGVHLRGLGVIHKKLYGMYSRRLSLFTYTKKEKNIGNFHLEDEYLRNKYIIKYVCKYYNYSIPKRKFGKDKPEAILLHRKLIRKNGISNT